MKRKEIYIIMILIAAISVSGCAQLKEKFTRKSKDEEKGLKRYYAVRQYDVHPSIELYTKRYVFWKNWHRELMELLTSDSLVTTPSYKKRTVAVEQEVSNLMDMQSMLVDEKAEELQKIIDEMTAVEKRIKSEKITSGNVTSIRRKMDQLGKEVKRDFSYRKMGNYIAVDFRDDAPVGESAGEPGGSDE